MEITKRPVWVEISQENLVANYRWLRERLGQNADLLAVVKANSYGHGLELCAPPLAQAGVEWLGITSVEEGLKLRKLCPQSRILVMTGIWRGQAEAAVSNRLAPAVWEIEHLKEMDAAALAAGLYSVPVHLELDTGMSRQGVQVQEGIDALKPLLHWFQRPGSRLRLEGVMTHFSASEDMTSDANQQQVNRLRAAADVIAAEGLKPQWLHAGASATLLAGRGRSALDAIASRLGARLMLRPGLALYGCWPLFTPADALELPEERPVLAWKTRVTSLREIGPGLQAGYNGIFEAKRPTRLALLAVGYADGLNRRLSNSFHMLIRGHKAPIAGRISMDHTMIDVTDIPGVEVGDEAVILGSQGKERITAQQQADVVGTISWEILCDIDHRVPRLKAMAKGKIPE